MGLSDAKNTVFQRRVSGIQCRDGSQILENLTRRGNLKVRNWAETYHAGIGRLRKFTNPNNLIHAGLPANISYLITYC
jgi:hypothetical protein